jgi:hypothetical protein
MNGLFLSMRKWLIIALGLTAAACTPAAGGSSSGPKIKARIVRITCASTVLQILDSAYYSRGVAWSPDSNITVEHAAYVINNCELPATLIEGKEFYFKEITASEAKRGCIVCMMYDNPPSKGIYIRVVN